MNWFHQLSSPQLAFVIISLTIVGALGGLTLVVRPVRASTLHRHLDNGTIIGLLAALIGVYAIAAGLTAVAVWENMNEAAADVGKEAAAIAVLYHDLEGYPQPLQSQAKRALMVYTQYVIDEEWPMHQRGEVPSEVLYKVEEARRATIAFEPETAGQRITHAQVLSSYNHLLNAQWRRLQAVTDTALPVELWVIVILLGAIAIFSCFLLRIDSFLLHAMVTLLVASPIALVLYFIAVSDHPFAGGISASPEPYRAVINKLMIPDLGKSQ